MRRNQAAFGRHAQSVRIVSQLPITLQAKSAQGDRAVRVIYLKRATITIRETDSGEIVIEVEPP